MPQYDYICSNCDEPWAEIISFKEYEKKMGKKKKCPSCGKFKLERHIGGGDYSFKLNGGGWPSKDIKERGM
jgi:putative FmdB family regulatory protein